MDRNSYKWLGCLAIVLLVAGAGSWLWRRTTRHDAAHPLVEHMYPVQTTSEFPTTPLDQVIPQAQGTHFVDEAGHTESPRTGADYLRLTKAGYDWENNADNKISSWFKFAAEPQELLKRAKPSRMSYLLDMDWTHDPLGWLPPEMGIDFNGSNTYAARAAGKPFHFLWPKATYKLTDNGNTIVIDDGEKGQILITVLARGDFNNDSVQDMMISVNKYVQDATYAEYEIVILTRIQPGVPVTILNVHL